MIYSGRRIFTEGGCEYVTRKSFEVHDIRSLEDYCFLDHFKTHGPKVWVYINGEEQPFVMLESFDYLDELWKKSRFGENINRIPKFEP